MYSFLPQQAYTETEKKCGLEPEQVCNDVQRQDCRTVPDCQQVTKHKNVDNRVCNPIHEKQCKTVYEEECTGSPIDSYNPQQCKQVPREKCETITKEE